MNSKIILVLSLSALFSACSSGGGGGGGPSSNIPEILKAPGLSCGGVNCLSGGNVTSSVASLSTSRYLDFKAAYDGINGADLILIKNLINTFNTIADDEGITTCDDVPTSGSYVDGDLSLTFNTSSESWNLDGAGLVSMDRKVFLSDVTSRAEVHFKCAGSTQYLHVIYDNSLGGGGKAESFSIMNTETSAMTIQAARIEGGLTSMFYFTSDGSNVFEVARFEIYGGGHSSVLGKSFKNSIYDLSDTALEYVFSSVSGADLDAVDFGDSGTSERFCANNYRSSSVSISPFSCDPDDDPLSPAKYALLTSNPNLLGSSGSPAWNTSYLSGLTIADPQEEP